MPVYRPKVYEISEPVYHNEVTQTFRLNSAIGCNETVLAIQLTGDESREFEGMWKYPVLLFFYNPKRNLNWNRERNEPTNHGKGLADSNLCLPNT